MNYFLLIPIRSFLLFTASFFAISSNSLAGFLQQEVVIQAPATQETKVIIVDPNISQLKPSVEIQTIEFSDITFIEMPNASTSLPQLIEQESPVIQQDILPPPEAFHDFSIQAAPPSAIDEELFNNHSEILHGFDASEFQSDNIPTEIIQFHQNANDESHFGPHESATPYIPETWFEIDRNSDDLIPSTYDITPEEAFRFVNQAENE